MPSCPACDTTQVAIRGQRKRPTTAPATPANPALVYRNIVTIYYRCLGCAWEWSESTRTDKDDGNRIDEPTARP